MKVKKKDKKEGKKDKKTSKIENKKLSTQEAIALAIVPKQPKSLPKKDNNEDIEQIGNDINHLYDQKEKLTKRELDFLVFHLALGQSKIDAIKSAGYRASHGSYLYLLAKKIVEKYEAQTEDHRKIFRSMGAGEVFVAKGLIGLAKDSKSDMVKLNAYAQIAKILGLTKDQVQGNQGIMIIFKGAQAGGDTNVLISPQAPTQTGEQVQAPTYPGKVLQITK